MQANFTPEDVLRFIYGEVSPEEHLAIAKALEEDDALFELYQELNSTAKRIEPFSAEPKQSTLEIILGHSQFSEEHWH